jgi:hypothetical protein
MINVIPIQGPNGNISAANTSLLEQNVLSHTYHNSSNLLAQTLLTQKNSSQVYRSNTYDDEYLDELRKIINNNTKLIESLSKIIIDLTKKYESIVNNNVSYDFDPSYILYNTNNGYYYSSFSDFVYYNGKSSVFTPNEFTSIFRSYTTINLGNNKLSHNVFDETTHGRISSLENNNDASTILHSLASSSIPGFMSINDFNYLSKFVSEFGASGSLTTQTIDNRIKKVQQDNQSIWEGALNNNGLNSGKLSYIGDSGNDRVAYSKYDTWSKIARELDNFSQRINVINNYDYLIKGASDSMPDVNSDYIKWGESYIRVKQYLDGSWWTYDDLNLYLYKDGSQISINTDVFSPSSQNNSVFYSYNGASGSITGLPAGLNIPTESEWISLLNSSFLNGGQDIQGRLFSNDYSLNTFNVNTDYGYIDNSKNYIVSNSQDRFVYYFVNKGSYLYPGFVRINEIGNGNIYSIITPVNSSPIPDQLAVKVRYKVDPSVATILKSDRPLPSIYNNEQTVFNTAIFNNYVQYYKNGLSYGDKKISNPKWDVVIQGQLDESNAKIGQIESDLISVVNTGGRYIGVNFSYAKSIPSGGATGLMLKDFDVSTLPFTIQNNDWTFILDDELHSNHLTKWIYDGATTDSNSHTANGFSYAYVIQSDLATNSAAGVVKGVADPGDGTVDGKITVSSNGEMSVIGFSKTTTTPKELTLNIGWPTGSVQDKVTYNTSNDSSIRLPKGLISTSTNTSIFTILSNSGTSGNIYFDSLEETDTNSFYYNPDSSCRLIYRSINTSSGVVEDQLSYLPHASSLSHGTVCISSNFSVSGGKLYLSTNKYANPNILTFEYGYDVNPSISPTPKSYDGSGDLTINLPRGIIAGDKSNTPYEIWRGAAIIGNEQYNVSSNIFGRVRLIAPRVNTSTGDTVSNSDYTYYIPEATTSLNGTIILGSTLSFDSATHKTNVRLNDYTAQGVIGNTQSNEASRTYFIQNNNSGELVVNVP